MSPEHVHFLIVMFWGIGGGIIGAECVHWERRWRLPPFVGLAIALAAILILRLIFR